MRHRDMVEAARLEPLIQEAKGQKPKPCQALSWRIGDWLIVKQTLPLKGGDLNK